MQTPKQFILLCILLALSQSLHAQYSESIRSDRPGQANGPFTVGKGVWQLQSGLDFLSAKDSALETDGWFTGHVIRFGLSERVELNVVAVYQYQQLESGTQQSIENGLSDVQLGFRVRLSDQRGWIPDSCFQLGVSLPDISDSFGTNNPAPTLIWIAAWSFPKGMGLTTNWILSYNGDDPYATGGYVVNFGFPISGNWSGFIENYGQTRRGIWETRFDGGLAYLVHKDIQLDLSAGFGDNRGVRDYFVSTGMSWRIAGKDESEKRSANEQKNLKTL